MNDAVYRAIQRETNKIDKQIKAILAKTPFHFVMIQCKMFDRTSIIVSDLDFDLMQGINTGHGYQMEKDEIKNLVDELLEMNQGNHYYSRTILNAKLPEFWKKNEDGKYDSVSMFLASADLCKKPECTKIVRLILSDKEFGHRHFCYTHAIEAFKASAAKIKPRGYKKILDNSYSI